MCGITGYFDVGEKSSISETVLKKMAKAILHRGPDETTYFSKSKLNVAFNRLSIIDVKNGSQPFYSNDGSVVLFCNGEIFNYRALGEHLQRKGYRLRTQCDVEVIVHLYVEYGMECLNKLNGQFAFVLFDLKKQLLYLVRDHFGICPLFYTVVNDVVVFGSEIKSILQYPDVKREVNLKALDQIFTFPGMVSPATLFKNIHSLKPGHYIQIDANARLTEFEYWDIIYPEEANLDSSLSARDTVEQLEALLIQSVRYRLNADVPLGYYLSGGLDSSLIAALLKKIKPESRYNSYSVSFSDENHQEYNELKYQECISKHVNSNHLNISFGVDDVERRLKQAVYHAEGALKETYNTCSLALSETARKSGTKVILSGEGADELFGGYIGYNLDLIRAQSKGNSSSIDEILEDQMREKLWGDKRLLYERNKVEFTEVKRSLYSRRLNDQFSDFNCLSSNVVNKGRLLGRCLFHQRSYLDLKLRLADHLISDHADRVNYANSVEGRYPFLDIDLVEFVRKIHPATMINSADQKLLLKSIARKYIPHQIANRQKFGFVAPPSTRLLKKNAAWINDMLSPETIKRHGYFEPSTIERLKRLYSQDGFMLNLPFDNDLLTIVLTFGIFLDVFEMSSV